MADMNMDGGMPTSTPAVSGGSPKKVAIIVVVIIVIALIAYFATRGGSATPADTTAPDSSDASVNADLPNIDQAVPGTLATDTPAATGTGTLR